MPNWNRLANESGSITISKTRKTGTRYGRDQADASSQDFRANQTRAGGREYPGTRAVGSCSSEFRTDPAWNSWRNLPNKTCKQALCGARQSAETIFSLVTNTRFARSTGAVGPVTPTTTPVSLRKSRARHDLNVPGPQKRRASVCGRRAALHSGSVPLNAPLRSPLHFPARRPQTEASVSLPRWA
jgi:hypothetical protein